MLWLLPLLALSLAACAGRRPLPPPRVLSRTSEETIAQLKDVNVRMLTLRTPSGRLIRLHRSDATAVTRNGMRIDPLEIARGTQVRAVWRFDSKGRPWAEQLAVIATPPPNPYYANSANNNQPNSRLNDADRNLLGTFGQMNP